MITNFHHSDVVEGELGEVRGPLHVAGVYIKTISSQLYDPLIYLICNNFSLSLSAVNYAVYRKFGNICAM